MKRITKQTKAIADAHLAAKVAGKFDDPKVTTRNEVIAALRDGKTFSDVLHQIELWFMPVDTIVLSELFGSQSSTYKAAVYKGFKALLDK